MKSRNLNDMSKNKNVTSYLNLIYIKKYFIILIKYLIHVLAHANLSATN